MHFHDDNGHWSLYLTSKLQIMMGYIPSGTKQADFEFICVCKFCQIKKIQVKAKNRYDPREAILRKSKIYVR